MTRPDVLILGGNSRIARATAAALGARAVRVARAGGEGVRGIGDYAAMTARDFAGLTAVVNCAGLVAGPAALLEAVNVDLQARLAEAARAAGVRRFVGVGSFSVLGDVAWIDAATPPAPVSDYGRSKLAGEAALAALDTDGFATATVRLPAIVGAGTRGKLADLLRVWRRVGVAPVPARDVRRSMIGLELTGQVLARVALGAERGVVHAADAVPFTFAEAARALRAATGAAFRRVPLPAPAVALLGRAAPALRRSMFADSLLDPAANLCVAEHMPSTLYREIAAMIGEAA